MFGAVRSTEELDLFATLSLQNGVQKIQHVANKSNMWQKNPMPGKKILQSKIELTPVVKHF